MAGSPPPGFTSPPYPTRMHHPAGDGTRFISVPMSYKSYDPGFNFPAPPTPLPVEGFSSGLTFSPSGYPLNPVNTCDPEDFGPSPVPFQVPPSFQYPSAPPPPGFVYNPSLLSYPPEPAPEPLTQQEEEESYKSDEHDDHKHNSYHWVNASASNCNFPGAILVGHDQDGTPIYAGRAHHMGDLLPAKVIPAKAVAYIAYDSQEIVKDQFEVMVQKTLSWQPSGNGNVPDGAIEVGHTADGEVLYLGRVHREGALTPGKIQRSHGCCYFPFDGEEKNSTDYEVLVQQ